MQEKIQVSIKSFCCFVLFAFPLGLSLLVNAQEIDKTNLAHIYQENAEVRLKHHVTSTPTGHIIYLNIYQVDPEDFLADYELSYSLIINGKKGGNYQSVGSTQQISSGKDNVIFQIPIPDSGEEIEVAVKIQNQATRREYYFPVSVKNKTAFKNVEFYLSKEEEIPYFEPYLGTGKVVKFIAPDGNVQKIHVFKYNFTFDPASPPMVNRTGSSGKSMQVDSTFSLEINKEFSLDSEGLYFFQTDTTKYEGYSIRVTNKYFPKLAKIEDLTEPIIYLSTRLEYKSLTEDPDQKQAMDRFWLKVTGSPDRAKRAIRNYYRNIETSNRLFTNYKPGWKTDKGMVYTIFGPPDEVYSNEFEEVWIFEKKENLSKLKFNFVKVKNIFSKAHFELKRDRSYEKSWYRTVDLWRKGRKGI